MALHALNLSVEPGEVVCLLGANGAGKTTTINLFLGFLKPDSGEIRVDGVDPYARPAEARRKLAYIPETVSLYPALSGLENLRFFDQIAGGRGSEVDHLQLLFDTGLSAEQAHRPVSTYSKGMRQKVGLAIAFAKQARGLLLDEPMSGLDPTSAREFTDRLAGLRDGGCAILMATHDIFRAKDVADRIGIMKAGRLVEMLEAGSVDAAGIERIYLNHMSQDAAP
jgi:ABC-2 type transport system ATP-binding protein